ncbi:MAG: hypothetical protein ACYC3S_13890 [Chloroflexota bacterium]
MRRVSKLTLALIAVVLIAAITAVPVFAQEIGKAFTIGKTTVVVFAPATVWQGTNAHVAIKVTNNGTEPLSDFKASLKLPEGQAKNIDYKYVTGKDGADDVSFKSSLPPGTTQYLSFTYVKPKTSMPIGVYQGGITLSTGGQTQNVPWNIDLREGQRFQATTGIIVVAILALSMTAMIGWFAYFKFVVTPSFQFFTSVPEAAVGIGLVLVFFGINLYLALSG